MLPSQPYYDSSITARPYDLDQARHYLELAGYSPPAATGVGVVNIAGIYNDTSGNPASKCNHHSVPRNCERHKRLNCSFTYRY